jgi:uncharacterized repeat protein (TIGR03803 family)
VFGCDGNFYGTTSGDQALGGTNTFGTVFRITTAGALTSLVTFAATNGACPLAGLIRGTDLNLYGPAFQGGSGGGGTIFRLVPTPVITRISRAGPATTISWTSFAGGTYRVEFRSALSLPNWTALVPDVTATGPSASIANNLEGASQRYYRVRLLP